MRYIVLCTKVKQKEEAILMNNKQNGVSRLLRVVWKEYKIEMLVVILAIIGSALASVKGTLFLQTLIDDYIVPLTESNYPDFAPLASALFKIAIIYILGILCSYIYNRIMVNVSQGTMKTIRIKLFNHMQSLPIQYFDSHSHGDIMSIYTTIVEENSRRGWMYWSMGKIPVMRTGL